MDNKDQKRFFEDIIEQHKGILFKVARGYCVDVEDRQDLIQEMMIQIWYAIHKYDDRYKISTFLYRISLNVAISFYRKNSTRVKKCIELKDQIVETLNEDKLDVERQLNYLEQFINELKDLDKALMILYLEDKNHTEIAEILGMSISNVGTKVGRIKEKLKTRFAQLKS
jgi:RNA polymerase sigma factor (sigma-70 family)